MHVTRSTLGVLTLACLASATASANPTSLSAAPADTAFSVGGQSVLIDVLANDGALGTDLRLLKAFKPAHGSVAIENGQVRYTPAPGYDGTDVFTYMVQAKGSQPRTGQVTMTVGTGGAAVRLSGQVVDDPIPGATVTVLVGGLSFSAVADAAGYYVLDIASLEGSDFVTIRASGTSATGAPVDFVSVVGEIARLSNQAGTDGVLALDENNQVNVTHISTAQYALLTQANGGTEVDSDTGLQQLVQNINIDQLLQLAAIINLVVDGGEPLPAGVDNVLALIQDPVALETFKTSLDPGQLDAAVAAVTAGTADLTGFGAGRIPTGYAIVFPGDTGTIRVGVLGQSLLTLAGTTGGATAGTGSYINQEFRSDAGASWSVIDNRLMVTPNVPFQGVGYDSTTCAIQDLLVRTTTHSLMLTRLQDGAGVDYLEVSPQYTRTYEDLLPADGCPAPPADSGTHSYRALGFEDGLGELPYTAGEALGTMMLPHYRPEQYPAPGVASAWGAALFDFATSEVRIPGVQPTFSWSIGGGRLRLGTTDASTAQPMAYELRRYQSDGRKGEGVMAVATRPDGSRAVVYSLVSRVDGSLVFDAAMLPARWRSGFDISQFQPRPEDDFGFFLRLSGDAAQTGIYENVIYRATDGTAQTILFAPFTWSAAPNLMEASSYRLPPHNTTWCAVGVNGCKIWRSRQWVPVSRDGNRIYVLERLTFETQGFGPDPILIGERPNFYEIDPL